MAEHELRDEVVKLMRLICILILIEKFTIRESRADLAEMMAKLPLAESMGLVQQSNKILTLIQSTAQTIGLDTDLVMAIAAHESGFDPWKVRYEPQWRYLVTPQRYAVTIGISLDTEITLQRMSWGPMQVMGSVVRELKYEGNLTNLLEPETSLLYGCKKLLSLKNKYPSESDLISAYNAGTPKRLKNGDYSNQAYVDDVLKRLTRLRSL